MYIILVVLGIVLISQFSEHESFESKLMGWAFFVVGAILFVPYAVAPFLPHKPWNWVFGLVLLGISMTGTLCLPMAIPILIFWLDQETKQFFGIGKSPAVPVALPCSEKSL
jgi:drug/metabolite transporter (DMT)-like permease